MISAFLSRHLPAAALMIIAAGTASADSCTRNFQTAGVPLLTGLSYSTYADVPGGDPAATLKRAASVLAQEGYSAVRTGSGRVTAQQETSGSGRPQTLEVKVAKAGKGVRAQITFRVQPGQVSGDKVVRKELCRLLGRIAR